MASFRGHVFVKLLLSTCVAATVVAVSPIAKVISLIEGLKQEVELEGATEAQAYDKFACFCRSTTEKKVANVKKANLNIHASSTSLQEKELGKKEMAGRLSKRRAQLETEEAEHAALRARCAKDHAEYRAEEADLAKAIQGLQDAVGAMKNSKPGGMSLLAVRTDLSKTLMMAEVLSKKTSPHREKAIALLQVDPNDPEYAFHSKDIINVCSSLLQDYKGNKADLDDEWSKTDAACHTRDEILAHKIADSKQAIGSHEEDIDSLTNGAERDRQRLLTTNADLEDDELYLKDLKAVCEKRATDYDQRSQMRDGELGAINEALSILSDNKVQKKADDVNERTLLLQSPNFRSAGAAASSAASKKMAKHKLAESKVKAYAPKSLSFLQDSTAKVRASTFLGRGQLSLEARVDRALSTLRADGQRLGSLSLLTLASQSAADPFQKVKGLIQKLIERLLQESNVESNKKGFCDEELAKAETQRDFRFSEAMDLSAALSELKATEDELKLEIAQIKERLKEENMALKMTTIDRKTENAENMKTISTAKEGLSAVSDALATLKAFYKEAAKAASLLQASPVGEDTTGPGFSGSYSGKQSSSNAIFSLLETVGEDFDRTIRTTTKTEEEAHRDFVEFSQDVKASIASATKRQTLDEQDLETTKINYEAKTASMQTATDLCDAALKELAALAPTCTDSGMSYSDRVKKREEEMAALKRALCQLDEKHIETECLH